MNENDLFNFQLEYTFTADWLAELDRQLALLLSTREGTMPLDRAFGLNMDFVDMPPEAAKSLYTAEVTEKVSKFIPAPTTYSASSYPFINWRKWISSPSGFSVQSVLDLREALLAITSLAALRMFLVER